MKAKRGCNPFASGLNSKKRRRIIGAKRQCCTKQTLNTLGLAVCRQVLALKGMGLRSNWFLIGQPRKENPARLVTEPDRLAKGLVLLI